MVTEGLTDAGPLPAFAALAPVVVERLVGGRRGGGVVRLVHRSQYRGSGLFPRGLSPERIMTETPTVGSDDEVCPRFLCTNALRVLGVSRSCPRRR